MPKVRNATSQKRGLRIASKPRGNLSFVTLNEPFGPRHKTRNASEHLPDIEIVRDLSLFSLVPTSNMEALAQIGNKLPVRLHDDSIEVLDAIILFDREKKRLE